MGLEKVIRFVAHVVPGNPGLLLSRSDFKALRATVDVRNDQMHLENPDTLTTRAGHNEVKVLTEDGSAPQVL